MQPAGLKSQSQTPPAICRSCRGVTACSKRLLTRSQAASGKQGRNSSQLVSGQGSQQQPEQSVPYSWLLPRQAVALFAAGAALGPFCDGLHSQHNVLHYVNPSVSLRLLEINCSFETCWWVLPSSPPPLPTGPACLYGTPICIVAELRSTQCGPTVLLTCKFV
jgi:hypothetical protein